MRTSTALRSGDPQPRTAADATDHRPSIEALVREHIAFVWRVARRLGMAASDAEDTTQRVLMTAARRMDDLVPGKQRAFLFRAVSYEVARANRASRRRREDFSSDAPDPVSDMDPEQLLDQRQAREQLDCILAEMTSELREAFVLFEIEGFGQREIAVALGIPEGTVASRLRRARDQFTRAAQRHGILPSKKGGR